MQEEFRTSGRPIKMSSISPNKVVALCAISNNKQRTLQFDFHIM